MHVLIVHSSPNHDGLTAACAEAAAQGVQQAGGEVEMACLNDLNIGSCDACDRGWGTCQQQHECQKQDDFQALHGRAAAADALVLITPVYWGEMSEAAKAFTDRLRRCEATLGEASHLSRKPVISVACAGGTGNGMITCLGSMERWMQHVRARTWDLIPVNRWSHPYKLDTIRTAAAEMVTTKGQNAWG
jgi:multimeric flavodoxin WrbA